MKEVKQPKKPLAYFYVIVLIAVFLINALLLPRIAHQRIQDVDYGTFMTMSEEQKIGKVEVHDNQILFTDKDGKTIYRTGVMNDPGLVERLHASGAEFTSEIIEEMNPLLSCISSATSLRKASSRLIRP